MTKRFIHNKQKIEEELSSLKAEKEAQDAAQLKYHKPKHGQFQRNTMEHSGMNRSAFEIISSNSVFKPNENLKAKVTDIINVFHHFDVDRGGSIDQEESLMLGSFFGLNKFQASKMYQEIDINSDGEVQLVEWIDQIKNLNDNSPEKKTIMEKLNDKRWIRESLSTKINREDLLNNNEEMEDEEIKMKVSERNTDYQFDLAHSKVKEDAKKAKGNPQENIEEEGGKEDLKKIHFGFLQRKSKKSQPANLKKGLLARPSIYITSPINNSNLNNRNEVFSADSKFKQKLNANLVLKSSQDYNQESKYNKQFDMANQFLNKQQEVSPKNSFFGNNIYDFNNIESKMTNKTPVLKKEETKDFEDVPVKIDKRGSEMDDDFLKNSEIKEDNKRYFNPKLTDKINKRKTAKFDIVQNRGSIKKKTDKIDYRRIDSIDEVANFLNEIESDNQKAKEIMGKFKKNV